MTRILFLADVNSTHTSKWVLALVAKGFEIGIFSLNKPDKAWFKNKAGITYLSDGIAVDVKGIKESGKLSYIKALPSLKKIIKDFKPDIAHAHYASSYGMLGALSGFHPLIISVWGSDVYDFPKKSFFHKLVFKRNLRKADAVLSTSQSMAEEIAKYSSKRVEITPFGVDTDVFKPQAAPTLFRNGDVVIGTVKSLEAKYGIEYLIEAFSLVANKHQNAPLKLLIVGGGSKEQELKELAESFGITDKVKFTGRVSSEKVPEYHNMLDIYVALSIDDSESFGVAVIEAMACKKPVVVSNVSGFAEVVENGTTGIIIPVKNAKVAASAIERIMLDKEYARNMGENGRKRVERLYNWNASVSIMTNIYNSMLKK